MKIETQFDVDEWAYVIQFGTDPEWVCPVCDGKRKIEIKGESFICPNRCVHDYNGGIIWKPSNTGRYKSLVVKVVIDAIHIECYCGRNITNTYVYYNHVAGDEESPHLVSKEIESSLYKTKKEAQAIADKRNKEMKMLG